MKPRMKRLCKNAEIISTSVQNQTPTEARQLNVPPQVSFKRPRVPAKKGHALNGGTWGVLGRKAAATAQPALGYKAR